MKNNKIEVVVAHYGGAVQLFISFHRPNLKKYTGCNGYFPKEESRKRYKRVMENRTPTRVHLYDDVCSLQYWVRETQYE
jgi:hypothetical protein